MGRPLSKKYFGNKNPNGIGGESVASVTVGTPGSYSNISTPVSASMTNAPALPGGTGAVLGPVLMSANTASVTGTQTGTYHVGDLLSVSSAYGSYKAYVASLTGTVVATVNFSGTGGSGGTWHDSLPTGPSIPTLTTTQGSNGTGAQIVVSSWSVASIGVVSGGAGYTTTTGPVTVTAPGGAVVNTPAVAYANMSETALAAIAAHAYVPGGSSTKLADIVSQRSDFSYIMTTSDGTGRCTLVASSSPTAGQAYIKATDANGSTYFVTHLTAHRARLVQWSVNNSFIFPSGYEADWSLATPVGNVVQIENY
jgi:hypothetical protein